MRRRTPQLLVAASALAAIAVITTGAAAHEFWLSPATFAPPANAALRIDVCVGDAHAADTLTRNPAQIESFLMIDPHGTRRDVPGLDGRAPVGVARPLEPGTHVVAFRGVETAATIEPATFDRYLHEEGLTAARARRDALGGRRDARVVERFSRSAKAIVAVDGAEVDDAALRPVGLPLELTPVAPPSATERGLVRMTFRLTHEGAPLADVQVLASSMRHAEAMTLVRSDADGLVAVTFRVGGPWRLHAVHMVEMPSGSESADRGWRSLWTSLVLAIPEPTVADDGWREVTPAPHTPPADVSTRSDMAPRAAGNLQASTPDLPDTARLPWPRAFTHSGSSRERCFGTGPSWPGRSSSPSSPPADSPRGSWPSRRSSG